MLMTSRGGAQVTGVMAGGRSSERGVCGFGLEKGPRRLMRAGIALIFIGHVNFILGAIVHGTVLRHVANPEKRVSPEYCTANIISVVSGLLSITTGICAILASRNLGRANLHWALLVLSLLNSALSTACFLGLVASISLTISNGGKNLISGCNTTVLPADTRSVIMSNECPFDTTRIYDTTLALWFPSMFLSAVEAALSVRCCVVAFILRGFGPCGETYLREREEEVEREKLDEALKPETHQLIEATA
ncbi:keratinocyte-associated protein 3 isoform X2 [Spea bombifrons]|uniref:keratinocyte-associated protein 3 isoform X2 n=1 Tax=Spea bombifrons TaxID=233779 RepID=UPI00234B7289|nr:keratinocyte-associated protein 3 isoform X2 [Spea bombifrons]